MRELTNNQPWWSKTLWVAGPVTLIAIGLVYFLVGIVQTTLRDQTFALKVIQENLILHHTEGQLLNRRLEEYMKLQNLLTQQLCVNTSRTADERAGCFKRW